MVCERTVLKNTMFLNVSKLPEVSENLPEVSGKLPEDFPNLPEISNSFLKFPEAFFQLPGFTGLVVQRGRG